MKAKTSTKRMAGEAKASAKPPLGRNMHPSQAERLVVAWEGLAKELGDLNETVRTAIAKQWPEPKPVREAITSRIPTVEDKIKAQTGNTDGPIEEWLGEFDADDEIGPREWAYLEAQAKQSKFSARPKAAPKAS